MNYLEKIFKKTGWLSILISLVFALIGGILIWKPNEIITILSYILGTILIIIGIGKIIHFVSSKGEYDLYQYDMILGIFAIILGIVAIIYNDAIATLINIIIGMWITYTALIRLSVAIKVKKQSNKNIWIPILVLALIMLVCGIFIIFNKEVIVTTMGIVLLIYSIIDIIEEIIFMREVNSIYEK